MAAPHVEQMHSHTESKWCWIPPRIFFFRLKDCRKTQTVSLSTPQYLLKWSFLKCLRQTSRVHLVSWSPSKIPDVGIPRNTSRGWGKTKGTLSVISVVTWVECVFFFFGLPSRLRFIYLKNNTTFISLVKTTKTHKTKTTHWEFFKSSVSCSWFPVFLRGEGVASKWTLTLVRGYIFWDRCSHIMYNYHRFPSVICVSRLLASSPDVRKVHPLHSFPCSTF